MQATNPLHTAVVFPLAIFGGAAAPRSAFQQPYFLVESESGFQGQHSSQMISPHDGGVYHVPFLPIPARASCMSAKTRGMFGTRVSVTPLLPLFPAKGRYRIGSEITAHEESLEAYLYARNVRRFELQDLVLWQLFEGRSRLFAAFSQDTRVGYHHPALEPNGGGDHRLHFPVLGEESFEHPGEFEAYHATIYSSVASVFHDLRILADRGRLVSLLRGRVSAESEEVKSVVMERGYLCQKLGGTVDGGTPGFISAVDPEVTLGIIMGTPGEVIGAWKRGIAAFLEGRYRIKSNDQGLKQDLREELPHLLSFL